MLITKRQKKNPQIKTKEIEASPSATIKQGVMPPSVSASFDSLKKKPAKDVVAKTSESNPQITAKEPSSAYLERVKARLKK